MSGAWDGQRETVLVIGTAAGPEGAVRAAFARLDAPMLALVAPARIICALFAGDSDAMMVAERLAELGWRGRLTVLAAGLPDQAMVLAELQASAPLLTIEVVAAL